MSKSEGDITGFKKCPWKKYGFPIVKSFMPLFHDFNLLIFVVYWKDISQSFFCVIQFSCTMPMASNTNGSQSYCLFTVVHHSVKVHWQKVWMKAKFMKVWELAPQMSVWPQKITDVSLAWCKVSAGKSWEFSERNFWYPPPTQSKHSFMSVSLLWGVNCYMYDKETEECEHFVWCSRLR